jgi:quercetin dioxygenase-like cupin family protein
MQLYNWDTVAPEQLNPNINRKMIHGQNLTVARLELRKGGVVAEHSHVNEQVSMILSGALRFKFPGREQIVRAGETLVIPPHEPHGVEVLEDTQVVDIFSPRRQDWIDGDDAYLRR